MDLQEPMEIVRDTQSVADAYSKDKKSGDVGALQTCSVEIGLGYSSDEIGPAYPTGNPKPKPFGEEPVAICSFHYRYHKNKGQGALKYQPVGCSEILDEERCDLLRRFRGEGTIHFSFKIMLDPACKDYSRKFMTVPSTGCPELFSDEAFCKVLLWGAHAQQRPTVLVVHETEADTYIKYVKDTMERIGVGIVVWRCEEPVLGFAVSRLAAQQVGYHLGHPTKVVLCDQNVAVSDDVQSGYDSDQEENIFDVQSTTWYTAAGSGTGVPLDRWNGTELEKIKGRSKGGKGRPIEQVVTVGDEFLYDPCFITSAEDADITRAFLLEEELMRPGKKTLSSGSFRNKASIRKVEVGPGRSNAYMLKRDEYLKSLWWEDYVPIQYKKADNLKNLTVGELAQEFVDQLSDDEHKLVQVQIRSLIIEKILMKKKKDFEDIPKQHPSPDQIDAYLSGHVDAHLAHQIKQHVLGCPQCEKTYGQK